MNLRQADLTTPKKTRDECIDAAVENHDVDEEELTDTLRTVADHTEAIAADHDLEAGDKTVQIVQTILLEKMLNAAERGNKPFDEHHERFQQDIATADDFRGTLTMITGVVSTRSGDLPEALVQLSKVAYTPEGL